MSASDTADGLSAADAPWLRKGLLAVLALVVLSPAFAWAAGEVGYAEPLENAAEATGAPEHADPINPGLFPDYGVTGLGPLSGTLVSGLVGAGLTLGAAWLWGRALAD